jgi:rare lipoprotein A
MRLPTTLGLSLALLVASSVAMAKQNPSSDHHAGVSSKSKPAPQAKARSANKAAAPRRGATKRKHVAHRSRSAVRHTASLPAVDEYIGPVRAAGQRQVGRAAWYGNQHVGRLTSSGEPLDTVHATAAHRSLPLHSLVRVTNLRNGRSVVVRINDRGPVSRSLVIDMSPRAAAAIDMINNGIAEVMIEPVAFAGAVGASAAP